MVKIVSDSSTLYTIAEGKKNNVGISSLTVTIDGKSFKELEEIETKEFIEMISKGHLPISSQPAIGDVVDLYNEFPEDEVINIAMADGLSGTYASAVTAKTMVENSDRISVINSKTLCGPHRYSVDLAVKLADQGLEREDIVNQVEEILQTAKSFLLPSDFDYLVRGGRLSPLVGRIGALAGLVPVMTQSEDGTRLTKFATKRTFKKAILAICDNLIEQGVDKNYKLYIAHAYSGKLVDTAKEILEFKFPESEIEIILLTPAFTTQGGPGCVAIQCVKKHDLMK